MQQGVQDAGGLFREEPPRWGGLMIRITPIAKNLLDNARGRLANKVGEKQVAIL